MAIVNTGIYEISSSSEYICLLGFSIYSHGKKKVQF